MRKITTYYKVQKVISFFKRAIDPHSVYSGHKIYVDIGCGNNISPDFINIDYLWMPGIDICMDLAKRDLPIKENYVTGVFTEHCLEHLPYMRAQHVLRECYRILKQNGTLRIIVPDGQLYFELYNKILMGDNAAKLPFQDGYRTAIERINGLFRNHEHLFIYDFETMKVNLETVGFRHINKVNYRSGRDENLLKDSEWRSLESLYVEAVK